MSRSCAVAAFLLCACSGGAGPAAPDQGGRVSGAFQDPAEAVVTRRDAPVPAPTDARETVVFLRAGSVWMMGATGDEPVQLTVRSPEAPDEGPALSPGGDAIAWSAPDPDGIHVISVMSLEDMIPRRLTDGGGGAGDTDPAWSPDGGRIAFVRGDPRDRRDLYVVEVGGGAEPTLLLEGDDEEPDWAGAPTWTPDGASIVFSADRREGNGTTLWLIGADGSGLRRLTPIRRGAWFLRDQHPTVAPDGSRLAFASNRHVSSGDDAGDLEIYAINPDGSGLTRLTDGSGISTEPCYSPDGNRLYFASSRERENPYEMELYVMAAEGGQQRRLTRDERPQNSAPSAGLVE